MHVDDVKKKMKAQGFLPEMRCSTKANADYWAGRFRYEKGWKTVIKRVSTGTNKMLSPDHWVIFVKK